MALITFMEQEQANEQPKTAPEAPESKRPKILSVSAPEQPKPLLSKPRILTQVQSTPQPAIATSQQPQLSGQARPAQPTAGAADPKSDADWAEQTLSQAERDAEEQRMANDVTTTFTIDPKTQPNTQPEKPQDGQKTPKTEPKSVPGLFYAIKGIADTISRKLTGK